MAAALHLRRARYDHPDARTLTVLVQQYYVEIYGGPDDDPLTADSMWPPHGGFVIGYRDDRPLAMGGWLWALSGWPHRPAPSDVRRPARPPARRRAALVVGAGIRRLHEHGARRMILTTGQPQTAAVGLYRASGYVDIAPFGHYQDSESAVHLGKDLTLRSPDPDQRVAALPPPARWLAFAMTEMVPIPIRGLFQRNIAGDDALVGLAALRFRQAGMGASCTPRVRASSNGC